MKTSLQAALVAASAILLAACASSGGLAKAPAQPQAQPSDTITTDAEYMALVERVARRRGVTIRWFNPPVKHAAAVADAGSDAQ